MLDLGPIKARVAGGWNVHPEEALLIAEVEWLREVIENAEHGRNCASVFVFKHGVREKCDCWKSKVNA